MNWLTLQLFGRLPIGWLQLTHHRGRMVAAVAGIAFANMLGFVQLGSASAMGGVAGTSYRPFRAHIGTRASSSPTGPGSS